MATQAPSRASAASMELSSLSQASAKAAEQLTSVLRTTEVSFEEDIPELEYKPNLDDILNDDGASLPTLDELGIKGVLGEGEEEEEEEGSLLPSTFQDKPVKQTQASAPHPTTEGAILRHEVLTGIANQLSQATIHNEAGLPTALAVRKYFAIGTSHGLVLLFDSNQQLKCVLNPYQKGGLSVDMGYYGAVSAVDINSDGTRLLCGYAKGLITHWDLSSYKCLRFINDAHPPGFGVLRVRFLDDPTLVLFSNTGGNLFLLKFRRTIVGRNWSSECIFSGCHGEALTFEPLLMGEGESALKELSIVSIATVTQTIFLSITPKLEALTSLPLKGSAKYLPLLAWNRVVIEHRSGGKTYTTTDAVLAAVRERKIHYIQCSLTDKGQPSLRLLRRFEVPFEIVAFQWIDAYTVAALDHRENIHLLSVKDDSEVEVFDLAHVELVYNSSFFKSIETGGNVSKALIVGSEHACYNSVVSYNDRLYVLGLKGVHVVSIKPWKERLRILMREGNMEEAIQLGLDLYDNKARAVVGLSGPPKKRREQVAEQLTDILKGYIDMGVMMQKPNAGGERELRRHYKVLVKWAFDVCLRIKRHELLFTSIYDTFSNEDNLSKAVFLEYLCDYIREGKIRHVRTLIVKDFIEHYSQKGEYQLLETCFLQILPQCLDIHQVVEISLQQQLYDALIHVHNRGLHDYSTPLLELLLQLRAAVKKAGKTFSNDVQKLGYKLLVYIRCCASGMGYPTGKIPPNMVQLAKTSMYETLLAPTNTHNHNDKETYPHVRTLLHFDTREFLNVIALAFEEPDFDAAMSSEPPPGIPTRQEVVSVLLEVMVNEHDQSFSPSQVGSLFTFLARQGAKHRTSIRVDENVYDQVLNYITHTEVDIVNEERQQALLELWHAGVLKKFDEEKLLVRAEAAKFYRLCELLYEKRRLFGKVLSCYLRDPNRRHQAFSYIHAVMTEDQYTEPDREEVARAMLEKFQILVEADVRGAARLVVMDFPLELSEITHKLQTVPELQFALLQGIFDPKQVAKQEVVPPSHVVERYIELLCRYQPQEVYSFLHSNDNYRVEEALDVCSKAKLMDATAYLLERSGDILGAFKLIRETLSKELEALSERYYRHDNPNTPDKDMCSWAERVEGILGALLQFCQRNSSKLASEEKARLMLWFPTFDNVHELQRRYKDSKNQRLVNMYNQMIADILNSMLGYISLQDILQKIIQDPSYQFKDIKQLIMGMLETYNYEETLLKTTNHILIHDVQGSLDHLCTLVQRGVSPHSRLCVICSRSPDFLADGSKDDVIVFSCGHLYHASCLGFDSQEVLTLNVCCVVCNKSSAPPPGRGRATTTMSQRGGRNRSIKRVARDEVTLDPVQKENLKKLNMSYKSNPDIQPRVELQLAPPKL